MIELFCDIYMGTVSFARTEIIRREFLVAIQNLKLVAVQVFAI
jgi:hypothetical protein